MRLALSLLALLPLPALADQAVSCVMEEVCVQGFPCESDRMELRFRPDGEITPDGGTGILSESVDDEGMAVQYRTSPHGLLVIETFEDDGSVTRLVLKGDGLGVFTFFNGQQKVLIQGLGGCTWL